MKYISERQLMPVTAGYNVTVKEPLNQMDMENMIVDIYIWEFVIIFSEKRFIYKTGCVEHGK